ncbi:serine/threonine protein kinase [Rhodococcus wratislaviensis IFP 2016]|nr:serine/threonine protein kinase [Rhodococcus wratislaviensis IFP 2016]
MVGAAVVAVLVAIAVPATAVTSRDEGSTVGSLSVPAPAPTASGSPAPAPAPAAPPPMISFEPIAPALAIVAPNVTHRADVGNGGGNGNQGGGNDGPGHRKQGTNNGATAVAAAGTERIIYGARWPSPGIDCAASAECGDHS